MSVHRKRNTIFSRLAALLFLLMLVRYRAIFVLLTDSSSNVYSMVVVCVFYLLNIVSMVGLFLLKSWGYICGYFAIPLSTFLFAVSYFFFITDWIPANLRIYLVPFFNAAFLIWVITLQIKQRQLLR